MKKKLIIIICAVVVVVGAGGFFLKNQMDQSAKKENEQQMSKLAKLYYEDYLYDILTLGKSSEERESFLSAYTEDGLRTSIDSIEKVTELDSKKIMKNLGSSCDKESESIKIIPKDPYGKEDYEIKVTCE
ncbi:hypothetical protein [Breznakia pachnodae]|uniref:Uncharacterized protein YxeA n=1 Tax=Breznakia pachnodae TaxID=265178 RepID=A0ABU0E567_9FIRM|nr:hypothetical protein [Breznakia pachnodae]MDQ0361849.1 uncharacterized protein YxeA [Breznakia pachnodae]